MKKVKNRAWSSLLIALLLVVGLGVYLVKLADNGGAWASYFSGGTPGARYSTETASRSTPPPRTE